MAGAGNKKSKTYEVDVASMVTSEGIRNQQSSDLDSKICAADAVCPKNHDPINADTQNGQPCSTVISYASRKSELGVDVLWPDASMALAAYDV